MVKRISPEPDRHFVLFRSESGPFNWRKVNLSQVFAGQRVGVRQITERIWLVSFMGYALGYFDDETCRLEPIENPFGAKVLPMML